MTSIEDTTTLAEICERITVGHVGPMAKYYKSKGIPFLRSQNIKPNKIDLSDVVYIDEEFDNKLKKSRLKPNDLVIVRTGYPGTTAVIPKWLQRANCSDLVIIRPGKKIFSKYLCYIFNSTFGKSIVDGRLVGAAQQHFNTTTVKELKIDIPDITIQRKIAAILSAYDDLIEINERRIALLEKMAEELYREWFVRMRFPGHESIHAQIESSWELITIGKLYKTGSGGTPSRKQPEYYHGSIPWVKTGELRQSIILETEEHISTTALSESSAKIYPKNTVVISMYCAMDNVSILGNDMAINQACCAFLPMRKCIKHPFSYLLIKSYLPELLNRSFGAAQQNLSQEQINSFQITLPPERLIDNFCCATTPHFNAIEYLLKANNALKSTRDRLLGRMMSGALDVEDLNIAFPPSMEEELAAST